MCVGLVGFGLVLLFGKVCGVFGFVCLVEFGVDVVLLGFVWVCLGLFVRLVLGFSC